MIYSSPLDAQKRWRTFFSLKEGMHTVIYDDMFERTSNQVENPYYI